MATAKTIGVYVYQGGWKRANAGTPTGYAGVSVFSGGWQNIIFAHAYASGWQVCWCNINGELSPTAYSATDFDLSPWNLVAEVEIQPDGSVDRINNSLNQDNIATWRTYDCGRDYQYYVERSTPFTLSEGGIYAEPTLNTWIDISVVIRFGWSDNGTGFMINKENNWNIKFREKVSAPAGGHETGTIRLHPVAEV